MHFARRWDWRWRYDLEEFPAPWGHVRAVVRYALDRAGLGFNLEAALRRPG